MAYEIGDPNHIEVHNELVADVQALAESLSVEVVLPDTAVLGDPGHVDDHNLIVAAIQKIADEAQVPKPAATGGTESTVTVSGTQYRLHAFTTNGTLTVTRAGFAEVLCIGGGGAGAASGDQYSGGGGGRVLQGGFILPVGAHSVVVGNGGASGGAIGGEGGASSIASVAIAPGAAISSPGGGGGRVGGVTLWRSTGGLSVASFAQQVPGLGSPGVTNSSGGTGSDITGTAVEWAQGGGNYGGGINGGANSGNGGWSGSPGGSGVVYVRYQI